MAREDFLAPLRIGVAAVGGLCLAELALFRAAAVPVQPADFIIAVLAGLAVAAVWAVGLGLFKKYTGRPGDVSRVTSLAVAIALLYLVLADWFASSAFAGANPPLHLLALSVLLVLIIALGRMLYIFFGVRGPDLAKARFQAIAPVAVISAAFFSLARNLLDGPRFAAAGLAIVLFLTLAQYTGIRLIWGGRREKWRRAGLRLQYLLPAAAVAAIVLLSAGVIGRNGAPNDRLPGRFLIMDGLGLPLRISLGLVETAILGYPLDARSDPGLPPLVLLITIDALRPDFTGSYNPAVRNTPALDRFAREAVRFDNAVASGPWTIPGIAGILTGQTPSAAGAGYKIARDPDDFTGPEQARATLAEVLGADYPTGAIVDNPWFRPSRGFERGFDYYRPEVVPFSLSVLHTLLDPVCNFFFPPLPDDAAGLTTLAIHWLENKPGWNGFLWLHYLDPHVPYIPHPGLSPENENIETGAGRRLRMLDRYIGEVTYTDAAIGRLLDYLRNHGLYDDALVIITADHGEELWDHGGFEHGHNFQQELLHVPLWIKLPGNAFAGQTVAGFVSTRRLAPTIQDIVGRASRPQTGSLLPCITAARCDDALWLAEKPLYGEQILAVGDGDGNKLLVRSPSDQSCYALEFDPNELVPLPAGLCPARLRQAAADHIRAESRKPAPAARASRLNGADRQRLKSLGYIR